MPCERRDAHGHAQLPHHLRRRALQGPRSHDWGHGDRRKGSILKNGAKGRDREDRPDADEGIRRADHEARRGRKRFQDGGRRRRDLRAFELEPGNGRLAGAADEVLLERYLLALAQYDRADFVVARGCNSMTYSERAPQIIGYARQRLPGRERCGSGSMGLKIAVSYPEPCFAARLGGPFHEFSCDVADAPSGFRIGYAGEGIGDGVEIGAYPHPQMGEVVAGVYDDEEIFRGQYSGESLRQLRSADPSCKRDMHRASPEQVVFERTNEIACAAVPP